MKWITIVVLAVAAAAAPAYAQDVVSPARFRDEVIAVMRTERPDICIGADDDWTIHFGPDASNCESSLAIDNMYKEYVADPARKPDLQGRLARTGIAALSGPDTSDFENRLVVVLRPKDYASLFDDATIMQRPFAGDLIAVLMLDSPESLMAVSPGILDKHGVAEQRAFELAEGNVKDRMGDVQVATEMGIDSIEAESGLGTGILWLSESCGAQSEGDQVLIFDRNGYFRVSADDEEAVENFRIIAEGMIADNASLSRSILACRAGSWRPAGAQ